MRSAPAFYPGIPDGLEGDALSEGHDGLGEAPQRDDDDGSKVNVSHVGYRHETVIMEQEGHLGPEQSHHVEQDGDPEALAGLVQFVLNSA